MRQSLTFSKRVEIYNFIKTIGKVVDGYWEYDKEWNDALVATHHKASQHNVAVIRMELGRIKTPTAHLVGPRIAKLEERVEHCEHELGGYERIAERHERIILKLETEINELSRKLNAQALGSKFRVTT
jgi:DNA polymerase III epsilon subunit-like protein